MRHSFLASELLSQEIPVFAPVELSLIDDLKVEDQEIAVAIRIGRRNGSETLRSAKFDGLSDADLVKEPLQTVSPVLGRDHGEIQGSRLGQMFLIVIKVMTVVFLDHRGRVSDQYRIAGNFASVCGKKKQSGTEQERAW